jgi:enolase
MVTLEGNFFGRASVPSGVSTGSREAVELRDGGKEYGGKGVSKALSNIKKIIATDVVGKEFTSQKDLDNKLIELDGTENKSRLGANAVLAVSLAFAKATAVSKDQALHYYLADIAGTKPTMPIPMFNVFNGGKHAENSTDIQEFMIVPNGISGYSEQLRAGAEIFQTLKKILGERQLDTTVGDEGGFAPSDHTNTEALDLIFQAIQLAGYEPGEDISIALDVAASELYENSSYNFASEGRMLLSTELIDYYKDLLTKYPIISIEDGLDENDWQGWARLNDKLGNKVMLVGDDLLVTNTTYIKKAIDEKSCNTVLIKLNQIGTLTETLEAINLARKNDMEIIISHRSGETEDTFIAALAVGVGANFIKSGSLSRSERLCKYNELLRIQGYL